MVDRGGGKLRKKDKLKRWGVGEKKRGRDVVVEANHPAQGGSFNKKKVHPA